MCAWIFKIPHTSKACPQQLEGVGCRFDERAYVNSGYKRKPQTGAYHTCVRYMAHSHDSPFIDWLFEDVIVFNNPKRFNGIWNENIPTRASSNDRAM